LSRQRPASGSLPFALRFEGLTQAEGILTAPNLPAAPVEVRLEHDRIDPCTREVSGKAKRHGAEGLRWQVAEQQHHSAGPAVVTARGGRLRAGYPRRGDRPAVFDRSGDGWRSAQSLSQDPGRRQGSVDEVGRLEELRQDVCTYAGAPRIPYAQRRDLEQARVTGYSDGGSAAQIVEAYSAPLHAGYRAEVRTPRVQEDGVAPNESGDRGRQTRKLVRGPGIEG